MAGADAARPPGSRLANRSDGDISYRVELADLHAHLFRITLTVAHPAALQRLSLPVWIPGSYLVREFSRNLQRLQARQDARLRPLQQIDKCSWDVVCHTDRALVVSYEVYALDNSVRTAWLDQERGFFNGTSLFLQVQGQCALPHRLELLANQSVPGWQLATGLGPIKVNRRGFGSYLALDYDELADSPVEMGKFWSGNFVACGVHHRMVVSGAAPGFDGQRLLNDTRKICETTIRHWHCQTGSQTLASKPPHRDYVFMLNAVDDAYGGLEHSNSTALIAARKDLPRLPVPGLPVKQPEGYTTLLGLISHEYFHTWNVKRLRPAEFTQVDYARENYTNLLWFFEGFTSYYDDLLLRRAGLVDDATYLRLLTKTVNQVLQTPGRQLQSVARASFDAWVKYYRQDENTANATVSYYTKGACVALCLDLSLRVQGLTTLDAVMRGLWLRCGGGPMAESDLHAVLLEQTGRAWTTELGQWVHGTRDLPLKDLLTAQGVAVLEEPAQMAQALGMRVTEKNGIQITTVLRGGAAERAGFAAGDEWLGLESGSAGAAQGWRLTRLDELVLYAAPGRTVTALVARDRRLHRLRLAIPKSVLTWRLAVRDAQRLASWLGLPG